MRLRSTMYSNFSLKNLKLLTQSGVIFSGTSSYNHSEMPQSSSLPVTMKITIRASKLMKSARAGCISAPNHLISHSKRSKLRWPPATHSAQKSNILTKIATTKEASRRKRRVVAHGCTEDHTIKPQ